MVKVYDVKMTVLLPPQHYLRHRVLDALFYVPTNAQFDC